LAAVRAIVVVVVPDPIGTAAVEAVVVGDSLLDGATVVTDDAEPTTETAVEPPLVVVEVVACDPPADPPGDRATDGASADRLDVVVVVTTPAVGWWLDDLVVPMPMAAPAPTTNRAAARVPTAATGVKDREVGIWCEWYRDRRE
jgi:hypothetical protein